MDGKIEEDAAFRVGGSAPEAGDFKPPWSSDSRRVFEEDAPGWIEAFDQAVAQDPATTLRMLDQMLCRLQRGGEWFFDQQMKP